MSGFVKEYKKDTEKAKASYYQSKLKFDVHSVAGKKQMHTMLYRYLEGC
jgi:5'-3' exonuclease